MMSILKTIAFGLFKIHLWVPVVYTIAFAIIATTMGLVDWVTIYIIGLFCAMIVSALLTYLLLSNKIEKTSQPKKVTRKLITPEDEEQEDVPPVVKSVPVQPQINEAERVRQFYEQKLYNEQNRYNRPETGSLYADGGQVNRNTMPNAPLYDNNNYAGGATMNTSPLYGEENFDGETGKPLRREPSSFYNNAPQAQSGMQNNQNTYGQLYTDKPQVDNGSNNYSNLYEEAQGQDSANSFGGYSMPQGTSGQGGRDSFQAYKQPVNSPYLKTGNTFSGGVPQFTDYAAAMKAERSLNDEAGGTQAVDLNKILEIYSTRVDPNVYVYEYADRYEYVQLKPDGSKEILKVQSK